jgi:hypothetical protein
MHDRQIVFDFDRARLAREYSLSGVEEGNESATILFRRCAEIVAAEGKPFTTDDVLLRFPSLEDVREKRCFGAVMMKMSRDGIIRPVGYSGSSRVVSHARPKMVWVKA